MIDANFLNSYEERMLKTIENVKEKFATIRAGRANVAMLDGIRVEQYGSEVPLNQIGTVSAPEARLLVIDPWDKSIISKIEKAILASNIGMTPNSDGRVIRLVIPELTEERRKEYVKIARQESENGKIAIRNIRKDANNHLRKLEKDKTNDVSEDEAKKEEENIQKMTDKYIKIIDELLSKKEKEITTV